MNLNQIIFVTAVSVGFIVLVLELIRRHLLREKYSLVWFIIALSALSVPLLYNVYADLAHLLGIVEVASFFFYSAIIFLFLMSLQLSLASSSAYARSKVLIQEMALLENRVRELEEKSGQTAPQEAPQVAPPPAGPPGDKSRSD